MSVPCAGPNGGMVRADICYSFQHPEGQDHYHCSTLLKWAATPPPPPSPAGLLCRMPGSWESSLSRLTPKEERRPSADGGAGLGLSDGLADVKCVSAKGA